MEKKIEELRNILKYVHTEEFIFRMVQSFMIEYEEGGKGKYMDEFIGTPIVGSKKRVYKYLLGIIMTTEYIEPFENRNFLNDNKNNIKKYVEEIILEYIEQYKKEYKTNDFIKAETTFNAFISYYDFDILRYREQTLEYIESFYSDFSDEIEKETGLNIEDYLKLENLITMSFDLNEKRSEFQKIEREYKNCRTQEEQFEIANKLEQLLHIFVISKEELVKNFGENKTNKILEYFSLERKEDNFRFFTQINPYLKRPLCKVGEDKYMAGIPEYFVEALYDFLEDTLSNLKEKNIRKIKQKKDSIVEKYFAKRMEELFQGKAKIHTSIFEERGTKEHDLLVEIGDYILICEIKGSKVREGNRNVNSEETFRKIKDHFNSSSGIGKGYKQANNLRKILLANNEIELFDEKKRKKIFKNTNTKKIIPIVLTLGQFGTLGINLTNLLSKETNDPYPWVCNLQDMENIIEFNKFKKIETDKILEYIEFRSNFHERIYSSDELDIYIIFMTTGVPKIELDRYYFTQGKDDLMDEIYFNKKGIPQVAEDITENFYSTEFFLKLEPRKSTKIERNKPCPCGSGKKYKKCCYLK